MNEQILQIGIFFGLQLINVVLNTLKSILMIKSNNKHTAAFSNVVAFTYYYGIIKMVGGQSIQVVLVATAFANLVGVYLSLWILDLFKKDKLWKITVTTKEDEKQSILKSLLENDLKFNVMQGENNKIIVDIFSYNQKESNLALGILKEKNSPYMVTESLIKYKEV